MVAEGVLVRIGYGMYARARPSTLFPGKVLPQEDMMTLGFEVLEKLGVQASPSNLRRGNSDRKTTQIEARLTINVGSSRISRRIGFLNGAIEFERVPYEKSSWYRPYVPEEDERLEVWQPTTDRGAGAKDF